MSLLTLYLINVASHETPQAVSRKIFHQFTSLDSSEMAPIGTVLALRSLVSSLVM